MEMETKQHRSYTMLKCLAECKTTATSGANKWFKDNRKCITGLYISTPYHSAARCLASPRVIDAPWPTPRWKSHPFVFYCWPDLSEVWWMWVDLSHVGVISLLCEMETKEEEWMRRLWFLSLKCKNVSRRNTGGSGSEIRAVEEQK